MRRGLGGVRHVKRGGGRGNRHCGNERSHLLCSGISFVICGGAIADRGVPAFRCQGELRCAGNETFKSDIPNETLQECSVQCAVQKRMESRPKKRKGKGEVIGFSSTKRDSDRGLSTLPQLPPYVSIRSRSPQFILSCLIDALNQKALQPWESGR